MESTTGTATDSITTVCRSGEISETIICAVAEAKNTDPLDLDPLYDVLDPDALNRIFSPSIGCPPTDLELQFSMAGCEVVVSGDGEVVVTPPSMDAETGSAIATTDD